MAKQNLKDQKAKLIKEIKNSGLDKEGKEYYTDEVKNAKKDEIDDVEEQMKDEEGFETEETKSEEPKEEPTKDSKADITITKKSETGHFVEINPEGDKCIIKVAVPNKVGKSVRLKKLKECKVIVKFGPEQEDYEMPPLNKTRLVDLIKSGNSWTILERPVDK